MESDIWTDEKKLEKHSPKFFKIYHRLMKSIGKKHDLQYLPDARRCRADDGRTPGDGSM
jgi:hypothetical protein